jgi:hypothetical protein
MEVRARQRAGGVLHPSWPEVCSTAAVLALAFLAGTALSNTGWVSGAGLGFAGAVGACLLTLLASRGVGGRAPVLGVLVALILAMSLFAGGDFGIRPGEPHSAAIAGVWGRRLILDAAFGSSVLHAFFFYSVTWMSGGWLAWWIARLKNPLIGLLPVTSVFAVGLLNSTIDQTLASAVFLALLLVLLLITSFRRIARHAVNGEWSLAPTVSRRYWAVGSGVVATAILGSALLPPLSTTDMSDVLTGQLSAIRTWLGDPTAGAELAGFSLEVPLGGPIVANSQVVFTYLLPDGSPAAAPIYFRGADLTETSAGQWRFATRSQQETILSSAQIQYAESYDSMASISVLVQMVSPPPAAPSTLFYPGQLVTTSVPLTLAQSATGRQRTLTPALRTLDLAQLVGSSAPDYLAESLVSAATPDQLRTAGDAYPSWVLPYTTLATGFPSRSGAGGTSATGAGYRPVATLDRIHQLALRVTGKATNPYDQSMAVESYLRSNYRYSLMPPTTPAGKDPVDQFLFSSKTGYCQFFATAMGDMLRSLGIPTRLVNGFGPGSPTGINGQYAVTESDAHTWVEAYFPAYGWIPFEPTPQAGFPSIARGLAAAPPSAVSPTPAAATPTDTVPATAGGASVAKPGSSRIPTGVPLWLALVIVPLLLSVLALDLIRWRPHSLQGVWRRLRVASYLAGVPKHPGETPIEFGARLTKRFPEVTPAVETIVQHYSLAAYGRPASQPLGPSTLDALTRLERHLARMTFGHK